MLDQALSATTFQIGGGTTYSAGEFKQALADTQGTVADKREFVSARLKISDNSVEPVADHLRSQLTEYLNACTDRIGHSFPVVGNSGISITGRADYLTEFRSNSSLPGLARGLIRAAAVLGSDRATKLVGLWVGGDPWNYKVYVVLAGIYIDEDIEFGQGLRIYRLPLSSELLPLSMPDPGRDSVGRILGHAVLEVEACTHPAFFPPPQDDESRDDDSHTPLQIRTALGDASLETFFLALSLVCGLRVGIAWAWNDYGEAGEFTTGERSSLIGPGMATKQLRKTLTYELSTGITRLSSLDLPATNLCETNLRRAWELRTELQRRIDKDQRFHTAVTRWSKAVSPGILKQDHVIELRVALESLYLDSSIGESTFRLSTTAARHLATGLAERKEIRKTLIDFYRIASRVIHGDDFGRRANVASIDKATDLCRVGILKILEEQNQPEWTDVLLG